MNISKKYDAKSLVSKIFISQKIVVIFFRFLKDI